MFLFWISQFFKQNTRKKHLLLWEGNSNYYFFPICVYVFIYILVLVGARIHLHGSIPSGATLLPISLK